MTGKIEAILALKGDRNIAVGRERIRMLEAVAELGSITKAAQALGFSYKYAWDAIAAINNLMPRPAIIAQAGGRKGGGAHLTEDGRRLIAAFYRMEEKLAVITKTLSEEGVGEHTDLLFWSVAMKTSARNVFRSVVESVKGGAVNVEVTLTVSDETRIVAVITRESAAEMDLVPGREAVALVKSSFVTLAPMDQKVAFSSRNRLPGIIVQRIDGGVNSEIVLDIGGGKHLSAVITKESAEELGLATGQTILALIKASHVILAVG